MHAMLFCLGLLLSAAPVPDKFPLPQVLDPRLQIQLVAAEPDLVTPTGLAVDAKGRVLVVESHTHFRPANYPGPKTDRVRMFEDTDGDGRADRVTTYFEGTEWTMNIGIHPDQSVYVATRNEVFRLRDTDQDGRADERTQIARLESKGNYPHNGLSGFAFDFVGNVYFGLGENLGVTFKLIGTDGSLVNELEGGQVYRCRADGSKLEMVAMGYWNPFHLTFDALERLFAVDNDPDSLPPCRLLHVVPGGNYGYRYRNGRKGVHPFTAWNGELPGTLPMVAGTGEAPSGVLAYESDQLPSDYVGDLLVTSWGDHRIERFHLEPRGASFQAVSKAIIKGDENFRPVGIAAAPDGSLFVSDWVSKSYDVHGHGRLWRISAREAKPRSAPKSPKEDILSVDRARREQAARALAAMPGTGHAELLRLAKDHPSAGVRSVAILALASVGQRDALPEIATSDAEAGIRALAVRLLEPKTINASLLSPKQPPEARADALRRASDPSLAKMLWQAVGDPDAFIAEAAREGLSHLTPAEILANFPQTDAAQRLATLLILREKKVPHGTDLLPKFLGDPDANVRFAAIQWVGEERLSQYRSGLAAALATGPATARLFGGYLSALERLDGVEREASNEWAGEQYIVRALEDPKTTAEVRRWSLRMLRPDHPALTMERLKQYAASNEPELRLEAVRSLRDTKSDQRLPILREIAADPANDITLRCEAVVGLDGGDPQSRKLLLQFATADGALGEESLRSLRGIAATAEERSSLTKVAAKSPVLAELVARVLEPEKPILRPAADQLSQWSQRLTSSDDGRPGDPQAGERVFFHPLSAGCARCHQIGGRGAKIGPELSTVAGALSAERLLASIVRPGQEIAPQFATWLVETEDGRTVVGVMVHEEPTGEQTYANNNGELVRLKANEIAQRKIQTTSIMPEGLGQRLTWQEFRDLLAFLQAPAETER